MEIVSRPVGGADRLGERRPARRAVGRRRIRQMANAASFVGTAEKRQRDDGRGGGLAAAERGARQRESRAGHRQQRRQLLRGEGVAVVTETAGDAAGNSEKIRVGAGHRRDTRQAARLGQDVFDSGARRYDRR